MKKTLIILLALLLSLGMACAAAEPEVHVSGKYEYILLADGTAEIFDYKGENTAVHVTIPATLDGIPVTSIGRRAFYGFWRVTGFTIPESVTHIGDLAFESCDALKEITIPDSVVSIGVNPFWCGYGLVIRVSPEHPALAVIDGVLFDKAEKRLVTYAHRTGRDSYTIPQGIRVIGAYAFASGSMKEVVIPDSVRVIEDSAFYWCRSLASMTLPEGLTTIGDAAFYDCNSLTAVVIPDSVTSVGANPFQSCDRLSSIRVSPEHPVLAVIDGVLFEKPEKRIVCYPCAFRETSYDIPAGIRVIGDAAFYECKTLTRIGIPQTVTVLGDNAFHHCDALEHVTIPDGVTRIGSHAFIYCALKEIVIPDGVKSIGYFALGYNDSLTRITVPEGVEEIGPYAFAWCDALEEVILPASVTSIGEYVVRNRQEVLLTVPRNSYAHTYCRENQLNYTFPDALDWLLE